MLAQVKPNRVASVRIAIDQAKDRLDGAVLASDAFFPFADNVEEIAKAGIKAIIQPGDQSVTKSQSKRLINTDWLWSSQE